jgi:WD40 repeat protein
VWACALSADGQSLVSGSWDHTLKLWELASGRELATLRLPWTPRQLVWSKRPGDNRVFCANANGTLTVFDFSDHLRPNA